MPIAHVTDMRSHCAPKPPTGLNPAGRAKGSITRVERSESRTRVASSPAARSIRSARPPSVLVPSLPPSQLDDIGRDIHPLVLKPPHHGLREAVGEQAGRGGLAQPGGDHSQTAMRRQFRNFGRHAAHYATSIGMSDAAA